MGDRSLEVKAVAATFMSVASVTVLLRCYVRLRIVKAFGWDDGAMVIAMVCFPFASVDRRSLTGPVILFHVLRMHDRRQSIRYRKAFRCAHGASTGDCHGGMSLIQSLAMYSRC